MPVEYTPQTGPDEYRCFVIDWPEEAVRYVTGFGIRPGEQRVVHHVIAFIAAPDQLAELDALDAADPGPGYPCYGGPGLKPRWLGGWVPGGIERSAVCETEVHAPLGRQHAPASDTVNWIHAACSGTVVESTACWTVSDPNSKIVVDAEDALAASVLPSSVVARVLGESRPNGLPEEFPVEDEFGIHAR